MAVHRQRSNACDSRAECEPFDATMGSAISDGGRLDSDAITYGSIFSEAIFVSERVGTWVIHELRDVENIEHLIGYMMFKIDDQKRRKAAARARSDIGCMRALGRRGSSWSRACRWVQRSRGSDYSAIASRILHDFSMHAEHSMLPFVSPADAIVDKGHKTASKLKYMAEDRTCGRPRARKLRTVDFKPCKACSGIGMVR